MRKFYNSEMNPKKASRITSKPIRIYEKDAKLGGWIQTVRTDSGKGSQRVTIL